jgi:hypothetical protein
MKGFLGLSNIKSVKSSRSRFGKTYDENNTTQSSLIMTRDQSLTVLMSVIYLFTDSAVTVMLTETVDVYHLQLTG